MVKKGLLTLLIAVLVAGTAFTQNNTVTVDIGPTIVGIALGAVGDMVGEDGLSSSGFGFAAQYERGLSDRFSITGRFAFLQAGVGYATTESYVGIPAEGKVVLDMDLSSFSIEGHARYYPFAGAFFIDGMLGYASMTTKFSGDVVVRTDFGHNERDSVDFSASRGFFKTGALMGWRIDFGRPGGFIFETALGYYYGVGGGDSPGKQLAKELEDKGELSYVDSIDEVFKYLEQFIFIGGPRATLSFGWRF
ncbi:MAG: hypothetical protein FWG89_01870 [Treponema sp.]|nr:hypothetical protein [Treponema sp.]